MDIGVGRELVRVYDAPQHICDLQAGAAATAEAGQGDGYMRLTEGWIGRYLYGIAPAGAQRRDHFAEQGVAAAAL